MMRNLVVIVLCACCSVLFSDAAAQEKGRTMTPLSAGSAAGAGIRMLDVGADAPVISIRDAEGVPFRSDAESGKKPVLLVFWSIFCEPCRFEMPIIQKMQARYKGAGLEVVAVSVDGASLRKSILGFVQQEGYTFKVLVDELEQGEKFKAADPYGVAGTPTIYLVDRAGKIALAREGRISEEELDRAVQALLKR